MGGTCAVDLTVMHPDMFSTFEDIAGDLGAQFGHQGADNRSPVRRRRRRLCGVRPDDRDHPARPLRRGRGLVRHQRPDADIAAAQRWWWTRRRNAATTRPRRRTRCARRAAPTGSSARWSRNPASTTGRSPRARSPRPAVAGRAARHTRPARDPAAWPVSPAGATARAAALRAVSAGGGEVVG